MQRPERSNLATLRLMSWIALRLGRPAARAVLVPIALYFLLFAPAARRASRAYLRRALGRAPRLMDLFRHFFAFAATVLDRVYLINDRFDLFDIRVEGEAAIEALTAQGAGVFLMGAHFGSFEVTRAMGRDRTGLRVAMVMYEENARKINAALAAINPAAQHDIIALGRPDSMLRVKERLDEGSLVGILGDRRLGGDPAARQVDFLGAPASLPLGPWRMAALLRRPVVLMAGIYRGGRRYDIRFERIADFSAVPRGEREAAVHKAAADYARRLEAWCREAPCNWFNFFDFWAADAKDAQ